VGILTFAMSTAATQFSRLSVEVEAPVARITLNHPPLNIIDIAMMEELAAALSEVQSPPEISVIVLSGAGKCFSAGVDVAAHTPDQVSSMLEKFHAVIRALITTTKVTIASVHGHCLGGGAELAMVCDLVYTAEDAQWGFPEIQLGCFPPVAATALAALVGQKQAASLILTGRAIRGGQAAEIGLAAIEVPERNLPAVIHEVVGKLSQLSPAALALTKKAFYAWDSMHFDKGLARAEKIYLEELMQTRDAQEGIRAFLEKRRPRWMGH
jgi:cyclohexa-1,5-dienecarbonyl-CoA hydratase